MGNYYCLMTGLPDISLENTKKDVSFSDLRESMDFELSKKDKKIVSYFFLKNDCSNLVKLLKDPEAEIDDNGNFSKEQYADLIAAEGELDDDVISFPKFMKDFVCEYPANKEKDGYFPEDDILYRFYQYASETCPNEMVKNWYKLNLDTTNILTAILARDNGWNIAQYIKGENDVTEMILANSSKDFNLSREYDYMTAIMDIVDCTDPVMKEKKMDAFKWLWLDDQTFFDSFSIDVLFAYICKLDMLVRWDKLDVEKGQETFRNIIENLRGEARVPDEFIMNAPKSDVANS